MRALVLADLDNVLGESVDEFTATAVRALERVKGSVSDVVTVFAFNTTTALGLNRNAAAALTFEDLRAAGKRFHEALGATQGHTEIALALTMPQTADVLLERLAREAPTEATSGKYEMALVFTADGDLADSLANQPSWNGWHKRFDEGAEGRCWQRAGEGRPAMRKPPGQVRTGGGAEPILDAVTIEVSGGDDVAAWASRRRLDIAPNAALKDLAQRAEREPWILSQIAATTSSVRGIGRMNALPTVDVPPLGAVSRKDGVEVEGKGNPPSCGSQPADASVGIGAVRFRVPGITARTHLPQSAFEEAREYPIESGGVPTPRLLQRFQPGQRISSSSVRIEFRQRGRQMVVKVLQEPLRQPKLWWLGMGNKTKSELRFDALGLVAEPCTVVARAIRAGRDAEHQVCLAADVDGPVKVSVRRSIDKGTLGSAVLASDPSCDVAVLSMNAHIPAGAVVTATPIQQLGGPLGQGNWPKELWSAPILVVR